MTAKLNAPASLTPAERALKESLLPREFRDVHFYAFTRRRTFPDGSIRIDHPQAVIAIGSILKDTDHFSKLLSSGFSEANQGSDVTDTIRQCAFESEYDYETDSDLDESEYEDCAPSPTAGPSSLSISLKGKAKEDSMELPTSTSAFPKQLSRWKNITKFSFLASPTEP